MALGGSRLTRAPAIRFILVTVETRNWDWLSPIRRNLSAVERVSF
jgi:hypothetical protein